MTKLLLVTTVATTLEAFLLPFASGFREDGWTVGAAARGAESSALCLRSFDRCHDMTWTRSPFDIQGLVKAAGKISSIVEHNGYEIVHVHTPIAALVTRFALRQARAAGKVKVIYTAHGFHFYEGAPFYKNFIFRGAEKTASAWTDHLIVINDEDYRAARRIMPSEKVTLIEEGVGLELDKYRDARFSPQEIAAARAELGAAEGDTLILVVAEFSAGKRHKDMVNALALTKDPSIRLAFAGAGGLLEETRALAESKGVADSIKFLGFRGDIPLLMAAADATALPSEREGLPRSVMESMASGTPVIGSDVRGIRDLLGGGCGTLVPLGNVEKLAEAFKKHKVGGPEIIAAKKRAKDRVMGYDVKKVILKHAEIYKRVLDKNDVPSGL